MRRILPVLALLLIVSAVLARSGAAPEPTSPSGRPAPPAAAPTPAEAVIESPAEAVLATAPALRPVATSPAAPVAAAAAPAFSSWALLGLLDRTLTLSDLQKKQAEEILRERNRKVDEYGLEVARRGWAQPRDFELRIGAIREEALRRLASVLDGAQAAEFARQAAAGRLDDHLAIEIPDNVLVLD